MDSSEISKQITIFNSARKNLLAVVGFSAINLVFLITKADLYFLWAATTPQFVLTWAQAYAAFYGTGYYITGLLFAIGIIGIFLGCWYFSEKRRYFMPLALVLFIVDSLVLAFICLAYGFQTAYIADIAFHVWILYTLTTGTIAWHKLRSISLTEIEQVLPQQIVIGEPVKENKEVERVDPLRVDDKKGRILIASEYQGMQISMKRSRGLTELIVDGMVYDEIAIVLEFDYQLKARINGHLIVGEFKSLKSIMYLYGDDQLLKKKIRLI